MIKAAIRAAAPAMRAAIIGTIFFKSAMICQTYVIWHLIKPIDDMWTIVFIMIVSTVIMGCALLVKYSVPTVRGEAKKQ